MILRDGRAALDDGPGTNQDDAAVHLGHGCFSGARLHSATALAL